MNILKSVLISGVLLGSTLTIPSSAKAHYGEGIDPNHSHVCTQSTSLNVRKDPMIKSNNIVGSVSQGSTVKVKGSFSNWETNETWYLIYLKNGKEGYVSEQYLCF